MTLGQLLDGLARDYEVRQLRSLRTLPYCLAHLRRHLGIATKATAINRPRILEYMDKRREDGATIGTIRREVHLLARAFRLAKEGERLAKVPVFPRILEDPQSVRQGFLTEPELRSVLPHLGDDLADLVEFLFTTAWRYTEATTLVWSSVSREDIRLRDSKTRRPRVIPLAGDVAEIIDRRKAKRRFDTELVFHRNGLPFRDVRKRWHRACEDAGLERTLIHDLRRSGIKRMVELGIDQRTAMQISGHTTTSTFLRYQIVDTDRLSWALGQLSRSGKRDPSRSLKGGHHEWSQSDSNRRTSCM